VLYVSSDYVFDGRKGRPYVESDLPAAISAYGRSKQAGETSVAIANPRHFIVRSAWLFGTNGPNFVETMLRVGAEQPEVIVVSDQVGCPTYTAHLAEALALVIETDDYGIHHIAAAGECSWFDYAQEIFDQADMDTHVMAGTTEMLARPAPRPPYSALVSERPDPIVLPEWRQGLSEYLAAREARAAA
jgi:dTDP-4-dehydrorhamnose reductase